MELTPSRPTHGGVPGGQSGVRDRPIRTVLLAWALSLGFDLFLHGGLLSALYVRPEGFLLASVDAFRRIPLGYAAFLVNTWGLYWLLRRLRASGWLSGFRFGLAAGLVVFGATYLGLYSITTAAPTLLVGWWVGQAFELGLAGAVIGAMLAGRSARAVTVKVALAVLLFVAATVILQSTGAVPTPEATPAPAIG